LALASKRVADETVNPYQNLTFIGLTAMIDPPRKEVRSSIQNCHQAGIQVKMITGDQSATALSIAHSVDLVGDTDSRVMTGDKLSDASNISESNREKWLETSVFARTTPTQKMDLIDVHQQGGNVVAMIGDGVNDAPALKKADIGVAMGQRGTQVAKEASDMILTDDEFSSIVLAVEQGRNIFANIRKFVLYLISCNIAEVLVVGIASLLNFPLPITPLQILYLNLITDVFPALALGVGKGDKSVMKQAPRPPDEPIMTTSHWITTGAYGLVITAVTLLSFGYALEVLNLPRELSVSISFLTLAFAQLIHVFNMRSRKSPLLINEVTKNPWIWAAIALSGGLLVVPMFVPVLAELLSLQNPGIDGGFVILIGSVIPVILGQFSKWHKLDFLREKMKDAIKHLKEGSKNAKKTVKETINKRV